MGSQYHLSSRNCRLVRHNHDPDRDPAKPDDLWTRRYQFGDYWKLGLLCVVWFGVVVILVAPLVWKF